MQSSVLWWMKNIRKEARNETRCDHIPVYSPPGGKPAVLAVEKPGRDAPDGRVVLAGGVCGRGRDGVSETKIKMPAHSSVLAKGKIPDVNVQ